MSDAAFYEPYIADFRTPFYGTALRPLSLGHILLLNAIDSAFVTGKPPLYEDFAASVLICCNIYETAREHIGSEEARKELLAWQEQLGAFDFPKACGEFIDYLEGHLKEPAYRWVGVSGQEKGVTIPKAQAVKVALMTELGFRECELMDRPWRLCMLDWLTWHANQGRLQFIDDADTDELKRIAMMTPEELDAELARLKQEKEANGKA